jgi:hypothetical protein
MDGCAGKMNKISLLMLSLLIISSNINADDSLFALMQRMRSDTAVKISYQEIRTLELLDQPWQGSGIMYSTPAGVMLREQLQPKRLLMAINNNDLFYYDPGQHIRHQGTMAEDDPLTLQFAVFQALINADEALLRRLYQIDFLSKAQRWLMTLTSKQTGSAFSIVVSGPLLQKVDTIVIRQADGDLSEFMLTSDKNMSGEDVLHTVTQLYTELIGE